MNFKQLVDTVAQETSMPAGQVKEVSNAVLKQFKSLIEKEENFRSPIVSFVTRNVDAREASDGKPAKPARKIARLTVSVKEDKEV